VSGVETTAAVPPVKNYDYTTLCGPIAPAKDGKFKNAFASGTSFYGNCATGCKTCTDSGATKCTAAKDGYFLAIDFTATACRGGCKTCTDYISCSTCLPGLRIGGDRTVGNLPLCAKIKPDDGFFAAAGVASGQKSCF